MDHVWDQVNCVKQYRRRRAAVNGVRPIPTEEIPPVNSSDGNTHVGGIFPRGDVMDSQEVREFESERGVAFPPRDAISR